MSRRVVDEIRRMPKHHRYLRWLRSWVGFRQIGIPIERSARQAGASKYSPLKLLKPASDRYLRILHRAVARGFNFGCACHRCIVSFCIVCALREVLVARSPRIYRLAHRDDLPLRDEPVLPGISSAHDLFRDLAMAHFDFGRPIVIGEYVGRIYEEAKARPHYVVNKVVRQQAIQRAGTDLFACSPKPAPAIWPPFLPLR